MYVVVIRVVEIIFVLCLVDRAARFNRVKKTQLDDAQRILSIFRQNLHVSGVSRSIIRRYNRMSTKIGAYYSFHMTVWCPGWTGSCASIWFFLHDGLN